jgi:hypothetical protein
MKLHFQNIAFLFILLQLASVSCKTGESSSKKEIVSLFSATNVEPSWQSPMWNRPETVVIEGKKEESENRMTVFSHWNRDSLSFFFKVEDTCLRAYQAEKDHPELYLDDMVEILIDTQNDKDSCWAEDDIVYHVNILGIKKDDRGTKECITDPTWDGNARIFVRLFDTLNDTTDIDSGYIIILSFPWAELKQKSEPGLKMGINFANGDNDGKGRQLFDWVGAWPMRSPYAYGSLLLKNEK